MHSCPRRRSDSTPESSKRTRLPVEDQRSAVKMGKSGSRGPARLLLLLAAAQVVFGEGAHQKSSSHVIPERPQILDSTHGIQKRSVSILARNGDLPYFRKEWNKKLHPGFRGMNVEDKDEEDAPSKRYVGSLARGGGYPTVQGKRTIGSLYDTLEDYSPEEEPLETYIPEDWSGEDDSGFSLGKRGGISSLARANSYGPYQGKYGKWKRSVAALARSGELLSIGRGSNQERDGSGSSASKRGLGSILRNGGISTIGKNSVHMTSMVNGKRGIESLARNYALPSMISQDYDTKSDLPEEFDESIALPLNEPAYEEIVPVEESEEPKEVVDAEELIAKRHLGSFVRTYGFRPGTKRNIGSVLRTGGFGYTGKRNEEFYPYELFSNDKRHFSSLLKNNAAYAPHKRDDDDYFDAEKRHLSSILHDRMAYGKRYLGSIARQGMLGGRHEKKDSSDWGFNEGQWTRGDSSVGKRSIADGDTGLPKGETYFDRQDDVRAMNETAEDELKNAAGSGTLTRPRSSRQAQGETKKANEDTPKHRQRRSLAAPYGSSDEYPMPVLQNSDFYDLGNQDEEEWEGTPGKRFMVSPRRDAGRWLWGGGDAARGQQQPELGGAAGRLVPAA
ncbi:uncharacterized protein LOC124170968 isoform X2 [Ischnura elegans]|uniref:uncharacterized protein LOC124170968 isoform X2 n=1 Tax=Ischnura elegans TaxID=197161 RepID=UPI001ED895C2|nr:uncharacterized protein LOC124170968 isoform X2 [Ischnura elegans]